MEDRERPSGRPHRQAAFIELPSQFVRRPSVPSEGRCLDGRTNSNSPTMFGVLINESSQNEGVSLELPHVIADGPRIGRHPESVPEPK